MTEKSANALRTIGEVAEELGVEPHVLRFWESKFTQIKPQKRRGRRYYRPQDVKLTTIIKSLLYTQGFTIKGAQRFLKQNANKVDESTILQLTESMVASPVLEEKEAALDSKEVGIKSQLSTTNNVQPTLFQFPKTSADDVEVVQSLQTDSVSESQQSLASNNNKMSDGDKRRLKEVYRGLCYTKEKLDEAKG